jgi:hypothetical protein
MSVMGDTMRRMSGEELIKVRDVIDRMEREGREVKPWIRLTFVENALRLAAMLDGGHYSDAQERAALGSDTTGSAPP